MAERIRTSIRRVRDEPTRSSSPVSTTRRSLACWAGVTLAISSRKSVPRWASSKRPTRSSLASVKAPRTWPNSSLSKTVSDRAPVLTVTSASPTRGESSWRTWAIRLLPVPCSPVISTLASDGAIRSTSSITGRMAADSAIIRSERSGRSDPDPRRIRFSASRRWPRRSARESSTWVARIEISRALSHGFSTKSRAPRRIDSTATSTLAQAVITTTGRVGSRPCSFSSRSSPSRPEVVSRV